MSEKKLNQEQTLKIIELYKQGLSSSDIAVMFNVYPSSIIRALKRNNIKIRISRDYNKHPPRKIFTEQKDKILELYSQGLSAAKVAEQLNISNVSVLRILRRNNINIRHTYSHSDPRNYFQKKLNKEQELNIIEQYKNGVSLSSIAEVFNVSRALINEIIVRNNITKKDHGFYGKKLTDTQESKVLNLYSKGITAKDIGIKFGVDQVTISSVLKKHDVYIIPIEERVRKFQPEQEKEVIELYQRGYTIKEISEMYSIMSSTPVRGILIRNNIERRSHPFLKPTGTETKIKPKDYQKVIRLYRKGLTMKEIADKFGVTAPTIGRLLRKNNILIRHGWDYSMKIKPQEYNEIINLYNQGLSSNKIAKQFNVHQRTILLILKKQGVIIKEPVSYHIKLTEQQRADVLKLREQELSINSIAGKMGVSGSTIHKIITKEF